MASHRALIVAALLVLTSACAEREPPPTASFISNVGWALAERWLRIDTHMHTTFSDGAQDVAALAADARAQGCHAIAITDHTDAGNGAASDAYFEAIETERDKYRFPLILAGVEWNIPPYKGREHVNVLVHPRLERGLAEFKGSFETGDALAALRWLDLRREDAADAVAFYNHPARKDGELGENLSDLATWTVENDVLVGFEGGPGHQRGEPRGDYFETFETVDGWDPVVAEVGGVWDQALASGRDVWGALATSDFHSTQGDYLPCEFSRTHVLVPEVSNAGVLAGLRAGAFWGQMGPFLERLVFSVTTAGLVVPAGPGESFRVGVDPALDVAVRLERAAEMSGQTITVELIGDAATGAPGIIASATLAPDADDASWRIAAPRPGADGHSAYLRLRARTLGSDGRGLAAYTNAVRVFLR
ncbi:MAG: CehA/McbA family metallohydrolase [Gammaproteobacteria bacterium]